MKIEKIESPFCRSCGWKEEEDGTENEDGNKKGKIEEIKTNKTGI